MKKQATKQRQLVAKTQKRSRRSNTGSHVKHVRDKAPTQEEVVDLYCEGEEYAFRKIVAKEYRKKIGSLNPEELRVFKQKRRENICHAAIFFLQPPINEFQRYLNGVWQKRRIRNWDDVFALLLEYKDPRFGDVRNQVSGAALTQMHNSQSPSATALR